MIRIAPFLRNSRNSAILRNPLICCANRYFLRLAYKDARPFKSTSSIGPRGDVRTPSASQTPHVILQSHH